jgi:hypothetical protein
VKLKLFALTAALCLSANASITLTLTSVTPQMGGKFLYTYSVDLIPAARLDPAGTGIPAFVTLYDFSGLTGTPTCPANFQVSVQNIGRTPPLIIAPDSPTTANITCSYTGATTVVAGAHLGNLTAVSTNGPPTVPGNQSSQDTQFNGGVAGRAINFIGPVTVPPGAPTMPPGCPGAKPGKMDGEGEVNVHMAVKKDDYHKDGDKKEEVEFEFLLHCDATQGPNSLKISGDDVYFRLDKLVSASCQDTDEANNQNGFDTLSGSGTGQFNGKPAKINFQFSQGEGGKKDMAGFTIFDTNGNVLLSVALQPVDDGHIHAHDF